MSANEKYALGIIRDLQGMTAGAVKAVAKKAMRDVVTNTKQDSGQAAFNWKFSINSKYQRQRFLKRVGVSPVGFPKTNGANSQSVINYKVKEITTALALAKGKTLTSVMIYHPMNPEWKYSRNAGLQQAAIMASNQGAMDQVAARAIRKYKQVTK